MKRFHLFFVVLFLGSLSILTVDSSSQNGNPAKRGAKEIKLTRAEQLEVVGKIVNLAGKILRSSTGMKNTREPVFNSTSIPYTELGVAQITYYQEGPICSGVHLKPWIVLTSADCVQNREVEKLVVEVTHFDRLKGKYFRTPVEVDKVTTDPDFHTGNSVKNLALLHIYARFEWRVDEFHLPYYRMTTKDFLRNHVNTFTNQWIYIQGEEKYHAISIEKQLTTDFAICGKFSSINDWFCAAKREGDVTLNKVDVGTPLFYHTKSLKRLFGMFSINNLNKPLGGHLYQAIYPLVDWIEQYITDHSLPPIK